MHSKRAPRLCSDSNQNRFGYFILRITVFSSCRFLGVKEFGFFVALSSFVQILFSETGHISKANFVPAWQSIDTSHEIRAAIAPSSTEALLVKLAPINVIEVATSVSQFAEMCSDWFVLICTMYSGQVPNRGTCVYLAVRLKNIDVMIEAAFNQTQTNITAKSSDDTLSTYVLKAIQAFLIAE